MANDLTGNPLSITDAAVIYTRPTKIKKMTWIPATDGDDLDCTSNDGSKIWSFKAIAAGSDIIYEIDFGEGMVFSGLNVVTIDDGTLYVYLC